MTAVRPELRTLAEEFRLVQAQAKDLTQGLMENQLIWRPSPGSWSVIECLDHLNTVGFLLVPRLENAVKSGRARGMMRTGTFRVGVLGRLFIDSLRPGNVRKSRTPRVYRPSTIADPASVSGRFGELQESLISLVHHADGLDLSRLVVASPASVLIRFNVYEWLVATSVHQQRHLGQGQRVRANAAFPGPATGIPTTERGSHP